MKERSHSSCEEVIHLTNIRLLFSCGCATQDLTKAAANACGCLVGVWQPFRDVIVTSGTVEMPAYWDAELQVAPYLIPGLSSVESLKMSCCWRIKLVRRRVANRGFSGFVPQAAKCLGISNYREYVEVALGN